MKKIFLTLFTTLTILMAMAQGRIAKPADPMVAQLEMSRKSNSPFSIRFTDQANYLLSDAPAVFSKYLGLKAGVDQLKVKTTDAGKNNVRVDRYQQYFKNIKVEHGGYTATGKNGKIAFISGDFYSIKSSTSTQPILSEAAALAKATAAIGAQQYKWQVAVEEDFLKKETNNPSATWLPKGELVFVEDFMKDQEPNGKVYLAYKFDIYAQEPASREYIFIDAQSGAVLLRDAIIKHFNDDQKGKHTSAGTATLKATPTVTGTAASRYSGTVNIPTTLSGSNYILQSTQAADNLPLRTRNMLKGTNFGNAVDFTDTDNNWSAAEFDNANRDNVALDAHWGAAKVIDYWRTTHGRNSYDNANAVINSYVHYSSNYNNAAWNGSAMYYGDGSNTNGGFSPLASLDVCGHEIGHAVCTYTANLVYNRESGAMNEALSDIWGAAIERFSDPHETDATPKSYFLIGEEIGLPSPNSPLRSMSNPKAEFQPDTYGGTYWKNTTVAGCPVPNPNTNDNCGVHYNSGVLNHWFYIMVTGKSGTNDLGFAYNITGIGWAKAEQITYLAEQNLSSTSTYKAARTVFYNAAITLYGACSNEALTVLNAFDAVGVLGNELNPANILTQSVTEQTEGSNVTYTTRITSPCPTVAITNYILRDTLPSNVTFVSATNGGTYNAANRVVSYAVNIAGGGSENYSVTVSVNTGSYFTPVILLNDAVTGATIPASTWTTTSTTANNWTSSTIRKHTAPYSYFSVNTEVSSDQRLFSTSAITLPTTPPNLTFWHYFSTESLYDGGILEISTNGGTSYAQVPQAAITTGTYNATLDASTALPGARAWSGKSEDWVKVTVPLTAYAGQSVKFRFRFVTDNGTSDEGWYVDDIAVKNVAVVDIRSTLFTPAGTIVNYSDTSTIILPLPVACNNVFVSTPPQAQSACAGTNASFTVVAGGTTPAYQWQVSTDGTTWTNLAGATNATLNLTAVTTLMNNNQYRVVLSNNCPSSTTSAPATLSVTDIVKITTQPANTAACANNTATFNIAAAGPGIGYQWQVSADGTNWTNITGATTALLTLNQVTAAMNNNQYRALLNGTCTSNLASAAAKLTVNTSVAITTDPVNRAICEGLNTTFGVMATGTTITYQWQVSVNGGPFTDISNTAPYGGVTTNTLTITGVKSAYNGYRYRVVANGIPCGGVTSGSALLTVNPTPAVVLTASNYANYTPAVSTGLFATTSPAGQYNYQWFKNNTQVEVATPSFRLTPDDFGEYYVVVTNSNGCIATSNKVTVADSASNLLFIYPNPTDGRFQVRYYNKGGSTVSRKLEIYNAQGNKVYSKDYNVSGAYGRMDVNLSNAPAGTYFVELLDNNNKRVSSGRLNIIHK